MGEVVLQSPEGPQAALLTSSLYSSKPTSSLLHAELPEILCLGGMETRPRQSSLCRLANPTSPHLSLSYSWLNSRSPLPLQAGSESGNCHLALLKLIPSLLTLVHIILFCSMHIQRSRQLLPSLRAKQDSHKHLLEGLCLEKAEEEQLWEKVLKWPWQFSFCFLYPLNKNCLLRFHLAVGSWTVSQVLGVGMNFTGAVLLLLLPVVWNCMGLRSAN